MVVVSMHLSHQCQSSDESDLNEKEEGLIVVVPKLDLLAEPHPLCL